MRVKPLILILLIGIVAVGGYFRVDQVSGSMKEPIPAMHFPEELSEEGCMPLNYHRVRDESVTVESLKFLSRSEELTKFSVYTEEFENQMTALQEAGANFVSLEELVKYQEAGEFPEKCVWISFDDGDQTVYDNAFPILKEKEIPFTLYIIAGQVGNGNFSNFDLAGWDEIKEMVDSGLASVGSHTYDLHYWEDDGPIFKQKDMEKAYYYDLVKSKKVLEAELGVEVSSYAIPFGDDSKRLTAVAKEAGFTHQVILAPQIIRADDEPMTTNRIVVNQVVFDDKVLPWMTEK